MYKEEKSSQIAAFFTSREGGHISHLKLLKLMYIADRKSLEKLGFPMTYDKMKSLPHGPILDMTLNYIGSSATPMPESWRGMLSKNCANSISVCSNSVINDSMLSEVDSDILNEVYDEFGHFEKYQLRDLTHDPKAFPEWKDPNGSSSPIHYESVFIALGDSEEVAEIKANEVRSIEAMDSIFDSL